jgi:hypothetical protein
VEVVPAVLPEGGCDDPSGHGGPEIIVESCLEGVEMGQKGAGKSGGISVIWRIKSGRARRSVPGRGIEAEDKGEQKTEQKQATAELRRQQIPSRKNYPEKTPHPDWQSGADLPGCLCPWTDGQACCARCITVGWSVMGTGAALCAMISRARLKYALEPREFAL